MSVQHMKTKNKMGTVPVNPLIWSMGLPMLLSMILQAVYNVVDTIFVINYIAALFCMSKYVTTVFWLTFVIAELLTARIALLLLKDSTQKNRVLY